MANRTLRGLRASVIPPRWTVRGLALVIIFPLSASAQPPRVLGLSGSRPTKVEVGPNILVSNDGSVTHIEPHLAADPNDVKRLIGAVTVNYEFGSRIASYASTDGGYSWLSSVLPLAEAGDPQVAFGKTGTVYFAGLGTLDGKARSGLYLARSEDDGATWQRPVLLANGQDHPQIVVDHTQWKYSGRIYIGSLYGGVGYKLGVFRSSDDGRTWDGPREFLNGQDRYGHNVANLLVLTDGTLFIPYATWTRGPGRTADTSSWGFVLSTDGAETFTQPRTIRLSRTGKIRDLPPRASRGTQFPEYAADYRGGLHSDRIYMVFPDIVNGYSRLFMQFTADRGQTWSAAKPVDPASPAHSEQFNQMVAVNKDGVVGVTWLDTRAEPDGSVFDEYFAASLDGGESFLPATRVSTVSSRPHVSGNLVVTPGAYVTRDSVYISLSRAFGRLETAGDYMGLTADADGAFHALWPDTRTGTYRLYTAAIRVTTGESSVAAKPAGVAVRRLGVREFKLLFDPTSYDAASGILTVPFRVQNTTSKPLYGPITAQFDVNPKLGDRGPQDVKNYPAILDARNGKTGPGAEFDLTPLIGSSGMIAPGATTGQFMLRIKPKSPTGAIGWMMVVISAAAETGTASSESHRIESVFPVLTVSRRRSRSPPPS